MRALSVLMAVLLIPVLASGVSAREKEPGVRSKKEIIKKEKSLEDVKRRIREEEKTVKAIVLKEASVLDEIEAINKELASKRDELIKAEGALKEVRRKAATANANIKRFEKKKSDLSGNIERRLKAMYKMQRGEALRALFSAESTVEAGRRHRSLTLIMDSDAHLIDSYEKNIANVRAERKKLAKIADELKAASADTVERSREVDSIRKTKLALLTDIKGEKEKRLKVISELEEAAKGLSDLIGRLRAEEKEEDAIEGGTGFAAMKGKLKMPVEGNVVSFYGKVKHPRFQTVTFNNGIVIAAPAGSPVKSVYEGKIAYSGWLKGYGLVLIIDHKGGFYTLFAHLSRVLKDVGATVESGEEVGLVGDTGADASAGLYFEVRQKGVPRDPLPWLAEK